MCKDAAQACLDTLCSIRQTGSCQVAELRSRVCELAELARSLDSELQGGTTEQIAESLEAELQSMDKAIEEAAKKIEVSVRISDIINLFSVLFCLECNSKVPKPTVTCSIVVAYRMERMIGLGFIDHLFDQQNLGRSMDFS